MLLALSLGRGNAKAQDQSAQHGVYPLSAFQPGQWVERVSGDFKKLEPFVFRIHQDAGYVTLPHTHPIDENITVLKGSWSLGMGRRFNRAALEPMDTGTFGMAPRNMAHFAWSKTETILQIHGIGPFASTVVIRLIGSPAFRSTHVTPLSADLKMPPSFCAVVPPKPPPSM